MSALLMISTQNILPSLKIMGIGMAGIFVVIGLIILVLRLLTKAFPPKDTNGD